MILRLPLQVHLFNGQGELVQSINTTKKSQIRLKLHGRSRGEWTFGTCRVWYNKPNDFWNEFQFDSIAQFDAGLITVTEKPLIDHLKRDIPKEYLEKRKLSLAQMQAIANARAKSRMKTRASV